VTELSGVISEQPALSTGNSMPKRNLRRAYTRNAKDNQSLGWDPRAFYCQKIQCVMP